MCGRFGLVEMAPKELWKAKVGFQKQKLIALHLAFQCHVSLSYTHAEWKPLPTQGAWGEDTGGRDFRWLEVPWPWSKEAMPLPTRDNASPALESQPQVGAR